MQFTALVPLKRDSRRLPAKNYLKLAGRPLAYHIFNALLKLESVDRVCAFTSSSDFMRHLPPGVEHVERHPRLDLDSARGLEILRSFAETVPSEYYILSHATSPFLSSASLQKGVNGIISGAYDSAMSVSEVKKYFWYDSKPVNYNINDILQTQYILPAVIETSGFYMFSRDDILHHSRRIGERPMFVPVDVVEGIDIDDLDEFLFARRFEDFLAEPDAPTARSNVAGKYAGSAGPADIRFILFEMEGVLADGRSRLRENVHRWLEILSGKGKKIGVVSNADRGSTAGRLESAVAHSLSGRDALSDDDVAKWAQDCCRESGIGPGQATYVGASPRGCRVAEQAGMSYVHAGWAADTALSPDVLCFDSIGDAAIYFLDPRR